MAGELIRELKLQDLQQTRYTGLECDSLADFSFIFGDLNYRLNSDFEYLTAHMEETKKKSMDQLYLSMNKSNNYPCYEEGEITWPPTYKLSHTEQAVYVNKKN